jgi:hypothetical protein
MRGKLVIPIIGVIILSFLGSSFAEQKVQTKSIQVTAGLLPDLVVDSIWLDGQCNINFRLKNSGQGGIPDAEHRESVVRVQFGSEIKDLLLGRIDPNGALKKAGGLVSFNTQITLKSLVDVKVIVDFNKKIKESDAGEKNNEKVEKLTPQCPSVAKIDLKTKTLTDEGVKSQTSNMPLQKSKTLTIPPLGKVGTQADTAPLNITILSPTKNSSWNVGSSLNIQWKGIPSQGNFHIHLKTPWMADTLPSGPGEPVVTTIVSYTKMQPNQQGVFNYDWKIPSFIMPQDYIVKIIYADDPKVYSKSEVFKIKVGGPSIITPKTLYSGPPVKGFVVEVPSSSNQWRAGEADRIFWQILNTIFSDQNSLDQMDEKVRIVLKDMGGTERFTIAQDAVNRKWVDWQNLKWTIPEGFPDGKYIVRVETPDGHFYGESLPFTIWNPKAVKVDKTEKKFGTEKVDLSKVIKTPPPQVTGTFKLLSMIPFMDSQTKLLQKIDLTAEIDASSDFQLVGDPFPVDPMLRPVSLQPHILLILYHKRGWQKYEVLGWDGYCGMPPFVCPTGVLKKGKNMVKFTIYVQSIPQSENRDRCNPSWWGPLTIKTNEESSYWDQNTGKYVRVIKVVQADFDLDILVTVTLNLYGGGGLGPLGLEAIVSQPRGSKYLEHGTLGQNYGCEIY